MPDSFLHNRKDFPDLLRILEEETGILAGLIEKDYWIMHVLFGLKRQGFDFILKGGTSLSKGFKLIDRFSEDIDIYIKPASGKNVNENPKNTKNKSIDSRKAYYDWLADNIANDGIISVSRDHAFDDKDYYRSGGVRLLYESKTNSVPGVKEGILLEAGFDNVTPNERLMISSWAFDKAFENKKVSIVDNRARDVFCYHPGYTFVEKMQTIATKFRRLQEGEIVAANFMRQYYDVYCLLGNDIVQAFIKTPEYEAHKQLRFPKADLVLPLRENEAFLLNDASVKASFIERYQSTSALYYKGQPDFEDLIARIRAHIGEL